MKNKFNQNSIYLLGCLLPSLFLFVHFEVGSIFIVFLNFFISYFIISKEKTNKISFLFLLVCIFYFVIFKDEFFNTLIYIYNSVVTIYNKYTNLGFSKGYINTSIVVIIINVHLILICLQIIISYLYKFLFNKNKRMLTFIFSLTLLWPSLIVRIKLNWILMILLLSYWILLFLPFTDEFIKYDKETKKKQSRLIVVSVFVIVCLFLGMFPESKINNMYQPDEMILTFQDQFTDLIKEFSKIQVNSNVINLKDAKNRYYTGATHLKVTRQKCDELYLKYYSGDVYENSNWTSLEEEVYNEINKHNFEYTFHWITNYEVSYNVEIMTVDDQRMGDVFSIYPYYIRSIFTEYTTYYDMYMEYEEKKVQFQIWNINDIQKNNRVIYPYKNFIHDYYLTVPDNLKELFRNQFDLDETSLEKAYNLDQIMKKKLKS